MKKEGKHALSSEILEKVETTEGNQSAYMNIANNRIKLLENTLESIKAITERNQYGNSRVAFKLIQEKINEVL